MRIVFGPNVLVSATISAKGPPWELLLSDDLVDVVKGTMQPLALACSLAPDIRGTEVVRWLMN